MNPGASVPHIAVVLHVLGDDDLTKQVALWTEACRIQIEQHVAVAWAGFAPPPGVFFYGTAAAIPNDQAAIVGVFADAFNPEAAGYHEAAGDLVLGAVDLSRSSDPSRTLSHECCEIFRNAYLDAWVPGPTPGRLYAAELCDPVQRNDYQIAVDIMGEKAEVTVADFVTPAWFDPKETGLCSWTGAVSKAFEIAPGGYQVAREGDEILYLPARGEAIGRAAISRPLSRTKLISDGVRVTRKGPTS
jgi:hypothetical protein